MSQIYGFQYYLPVQLPRKTYHFNSRQSKNEVVHTVYPSLAKLEETMHAPVLVQQFTHLIHSDRFYRLSYLLRQFAGKTVKIHNDRKQTKQKRKNKHNSTRGKHFSLFRKLMVHCGRSQSNCLHAGLKPPLVVVGQLAVLQTPRERRLVLLKLLIRRCRLLRRLI